MRGQIILSHGSQSGPNATKVSVLAALAESLGWATQRPDYTADDARGLANSVAPRIARLRATVEALDTPPVLVGSSMGAFVSGLVSLEVPVAGLLLLATPSAIPGYARPFGLRANVPVILIHGWYDDVCPLPGVQAFAASRRLPLLLLNDGHRLSENVDEIAAQFRLFLEKLKNPA